MKQNIKDDIEYCMAFECTWLLLFLIMHKNSIISVICYFEWKS